MKEYRDSIKIKESLKLHAQKISEEQNGAPIIIIAAGSNNAGISGTITAWANLADDGNGRLRDLLGILETAKQLETLKHVNLIEE